MTKIFVKMYTGYCGSDATEVVDVDYPAEELVDRCSTQAVEIDNLVQEMAQENAEMYGIEDDEDIEGDDSVCGTWEIFEWEKHYGHLTSDESDRIAA